MTKIAKIIMIMVIIIIIIIIIMLSQCQYKNWRHDKVALAMHIFSSDDLKSLETF